MTSALVLAALLLCPSADPAAEDSQVERSRQADVARLAPAKARQLELVVGEASEKASLHAELLLRWSNPTAGSVYGEVYLWSHRGRPVAIASIYRWFHPFKDSTVEFVSVAPDSVRAIEGTKTLWEAKSSGLEFKPLHKAPAPADSSGGRLVQMRSLARRFSAELLDKRGGEEVSRQLRLLNQPVHRYASEESGLIDGALFALVEVTDPEAWLLIEAIKTDDGPIWRYALARMNADAMKVRLDDAEAKSWPKIIQPWRYTQAPYTLMGFKPEAVKLDAKP